ncbi:hypothetical protein [Staphylococcus phage vB_StaM_SA1]|nr:hypothetical protein [Staphylococcus phage vB_StaM_SA1]
MIAVDILNYIVVLFVAYVIIYTLFYILKMYKLDKKLKEETYMLEKKLEEENIRFYKRSRFNQMRSGHRKKRSDMNA